MITAWMQSMPQVQAAVESGCSHSPNSTPAATTSSMTTKEAEMRVWAYCRSNSRSKAGRVPLVDVNRSRASRTRCAAARRLRAGAAAEASGGSWTTSGVSAGLLIHTTNPAHGGARLSLRYLWREIIKSWLKELKNRVNEQLN